jgi:hypothetical protein
MSDNEYEDGAGGNEPYFDDDEPRLSDAEDDVIFISN